MIRQNAAPGLAFPCTPKALLELVDSGAGRFYGSFIVPDEFRSAVIQIEQAPTPSGEASSNEEYLRGRRYHASRNTGNLVLC